MGGLRQRKPAPPEQLSMTSDEGDQVGLEGGVVGAKASIGGVVAVDGIFSRDDDE